MSKPIAVFATPRTGSTLLYNTVSEYQRQIHGIQPLGEYLTVGKEVFSDGSSEIRPSEMPVPLSIHDFTLAQLEIILNDRFELMKKYKGRYSLKIFAGQTSKTQDAWLQEHCECIFLERRNIFDQFLSFAISEITGQWYQAGGIQIARGSLLLPPRILGDFERKYFIYRQKKIFFKPRHVLTYEEISTTPVESLLFRLGLRESLDLTKVSVPERQNKGDKLSCFQNPDLIRESFKKTYLGELAGTKF